MRRKVKTYQVEQGLHRTSFVRNYIIYNGIKMFIETNFDLFDLQTTYAT